ncbi:kinesin-domain-containing protein [Lactarius pseudohatsudake]|nr:kinesin-domain-containing protein [Lactarius pseudohatsudake]
MPASFSSSLPSMTSLKRKISSDDEHDSAHPSKLPTIAEAGSGRPTRPLTQNTAAINIGATRGLGIGPPPLTKPCPPALSGPPPTSITTRPTRATSAPPKSAAPRHVSQPMAAPRAAATRTLSGPHKTTTFAMGSFRFQSFQGQAQQPTVNLRMADNARIRADMDAERTKLASLQEEQLSLTRHLSSARTQELSHRRELVPQTDELEALRKWHARELLELEEEARRRERELHDVSADLATAREDLERERSASASLKEALAQKSAAHISLQGENTTLQAQLAALRTANDGTAGTVSSLRVDLEAAQHRIDELEAEAREAEMVRRRLHNMVQELKGNIRVFARVRPLLTSDLSCPDDQKERKEALANMWFPDRDHHEIVLNSTSESATGQERKETWNFSFDRVFEPQCTQEEVFEEISQLAQSCTDGYNVCIFAYGQTGSGKSFTMEGGSTNETNKGWEYTLEGRVRQEEARDQARERVDPRHGRRGATTPHARSGALSPCAGKFAAHGCGDAHERALVALALGIHAAHPRHQHAYRTGVRGRAELSGPRRSERLNASGAGKDKDRLRETQNINKSLSALGDVIAALGEKSEKSDKHIPYRNSKLTYLLQNRKISRSPRTRKPALFGLRRDIYLKSALL